MRARLALASAALPCELREIQLRNKPQALLLASPKATVPVLVLPNGEVIEQSLDIMLHALRWHDPAGWLAPEAGALGDMQALIARNDQFFKPALDRSKYPDRYTHDEVAQAATDARTWFDELEALLARTSHVQGSRASLADMAILPFARQFAHIDRDAWAAQPWVHVQAWLQRWMDAPLFAQIMQTYPVWQPDTSGPTLFSTPAQPLL